MGKTEKEKEAQKKWQQENYTRVQFDERKEVIAALKEKCKREGVGVATVLRKAILAYLNEEGEAK